jgi:hypothetical protein
MSDEVRRFQKESQPPAIKSVMRALVERERTSEIETPKVEHFDIVLVGEATLREVQQWVSGCEHCTENAAMILDYLLDALTGCSPARTQYLLCRPAKCPVCSSDITEATHIAVL